MVSTLLANLAAYSAQVACLIAAATLLPVLFRLDTPSVRYAYWRALLALCLVLPLLQEWRVPTRTEVNTTTMTWSPSRQGGPLRAPDEAQPSLDLTVPVVIVLAGGALVRLAWLSLGLVRLRRLRAAGRPAAVSAADADLQRALGTRAEIRYVPGLRQPATFGVRWPIVLLPDTALDQPSEIQHAVLCHELLHVVRRDWAWVLAEELVRCALWFHPGVWWAVSRIQLAREEVVDLDAVRITGRRRTYIEALVAFADARPFAPAAAFSRRRHLFRRILLLSKHPVVSRRRLVLSLAAVIVVLLGGSRVTIGAFPLQQLPDDTNIAPKPKSVSSGAITTDRGEPVTVGPASPASPASPTAVEPAAAVKPLDTPRRGLEGVDALTRRLQQRAQPTGQPEEQATAGLTSPNSDGRDVSRLDGSNRATETVASDAPSGAPPSPEGPATPAISSPESSVPQTPIRVGGNITAPRKIKDVQPVYPPIAASAKVSGIVILEATIGADGRVIDARILRSIPLLDQAAVDAVRQWEFTPVLLNGVPAPVVMSVTVNFTLQ